MPDKEPLTIKRIAEALNITEYTARIAIRSLGITGETPSNNRRTIIYTDDTVARIEAWLKANPA